MINLNMADGIRLMTLRRGVDPAKIRAVEFRRRGGPARGGSRARTRDQAHHRADGGIGAVGLGHADQRSPLRSQPHALRRGRAHHRPMKCASCSPGWSSRPPAGCAHGSTARLQSSAPPKCATASRSLRSTYRSTVSTGTPPISSTGSRTAFIVRLRGTVHLRLARPGGRLRQRPRRGGRRSLAAQDEGASKAAASAPVRRAAGGRPSSAAGAKFRSMRSTTCSPATR